MRPSGRDVGEMRHVTIETGFTRHAEGSCLIRCGDTHVLCNASIDERVPHWMKNSGLGWVTAEYGMLPRATHTRGQREAGYDGRLDAGYDRMRQGLPGLLLRQQVQRHHDLRRHRLLMCQCPWRLPGLRGRGAERRPGLVWLQQGIPLCADHGVRWSSPVRRDIRLHRICAWMCPEK